MWRGISSGRQVRGNYVLKASTAHNQAALERYVHNPKVRAFLDFIAASEGVNMVIKQRLVTIELRTSPVTQVTLLDVVLLEQMVVEARLMPPAAINSWDIHGKDWQNNTASRILVLPHKTKLL